MQDDEVVPCGHEHDYAQCASRPKLCFILGVEQRSGTNYLYRLLSQHPDCIAPGPVWEDFLVFHSPKLKKYVEDVYGSWNPEWAVEEKIGPQGILLRLFGDAIVRFLQLQAAPESKSTSSAGNDVKGAVPKILLTKTPRVVGAENFQDILPGTPLIIIIRDGRSVVESAVRSFDWGYEDGMRKWAVAARKIIELREKAQSTNRKLLIIKFEDLFLDERKELHKIFEYLEIGVDRFDFDGAKNIGVTGSSDTRKQTDEVHWKVTEKSKDFNPLERFSSWDNKKHERFNWIAGKYMSELGYDVKPIASNPFYSAVRNRMYDVIWNVRKYFSRIIQ